ncbi:MAG: diaminopimelate decarboxylase [Deltaproteobacteria bacterium]|nr:diaminopimelate decarboxylase [Deltaproteobacteria bacterium]MBN2844690.1 diaminopimelate decarboxylase [Deltaproteobacteria bacterium]
MNYFEYRENELWCEEVPVAEIAEQVGTPFYLYSIRTLKRHFDVFDSAFNALPHIVCFSVKANSNLAILKMFINEGAGVDIVSGGELYRALRAGVDPGKVVYSGVGKREDEIRFALESDILMFNVESSQELEVINSCAEAMKKKARISLRVNPDVDPLTHPHISTGLKKNKFGIDIERSLDEYRRAVKLKYVDIVGVDCHIGSQITEVSPFADALDRLKELIFLLRRDGLEIQYLDLGGGLGISYDQETPPHPEEYAKVIIDKSRDIDCIFILEPGRVIVGNAGVLVSRVLYTKHNSERNFVIVDAGMNDLIRPSLYDAYHHIQPVIKEERGEFVADVVGPICESGDYLAKDRVIPELKRGDLVAVMSSGAYSFSMSSNYNSRPRVPEVLVKDGQFYIIKRRETYEDLIRGESVPNILL